MQVNIETGMMRYEFLESIVRAGIAKYGKGIATEDVAEAVRMILSNNIAPNLPTGENLLQHQLNGVPCRLPPGFELAAAATHEH